jgi:DNA-binding response OmpR family regulator
MIMMVEDDPDHREIYGTILWYNGFNVFLVPDAASALRAISFIRPDLILLDLGLPDAMGLEICEAVKGMPGGKDVPVVALSALSAFEMQGLAYAAGCRHYLEKASTSPLEVLHRVESILGRPPAPGAGATPWMLTYPEPSDPHGMGHALR